MFDRGKAQALLASGMTYRQVARAAGVSVGTLHAGMREYSARSEKGPGRRRSTTLNNKTPEAGPAETDKAALAERRGDSQISPE